MKRYFDDSAYWIQLPLFLALYYFTAKFGLQINAVSGFASLVWPPTGIALAAILICDFKIWPSIFLGAFLVNWQMGAPFLSALGIGIGNAFEAVFGAYILRHVSGFQNFFESLREVSAFILLTVLCSTMVSAHIGTASLLAGHIIEKEAYLPTWKAWWVGDMLGDLIIAPFILIWVKKPIRRFRWKKTLEILSFGMVLLAVSIFVFGDFFNSAISIYQVPTLIFPLIIWAAIRFGTRGTVTTAFAVSIIATWGTMLGHGPFSYTNLTDSLLRLQIFVGIVSATGLILAAVVAERKRAEGALRESELKIRAVLESTLDGIVVINNKGTMIEVNRAAEHLLGYHRVQLLGKRLADSLEELETLIRLFSEGREPLDHKRIEMTAVRSTGTEFPVEISLSRIKDSLPPLFTVFIRDLTDQKMAKETLRQTLVNLEESEQRFQAFMKNSPALAWIKDNQGRMVYTNEHLEKLFQVSLTQIKGKTDSEWLPAAAAIKTMENDRLVLSKNVPLEVIEFVPTPDGTEHIWNVLKFPFQDASGKTYIGGNAFDITTRVKVEDALRTSESILRQKTEELEQTNRELDDFAYIASHDLKEPLRGIANYARFILEDYHEKLDAEGRQRLETLANLPKQMEALINDLLLFSRVGRLGLAISEVDLNTVIEDTRTLLKPFLEEQKATINLPRPLPIIRCDRARISEVFQNLITNALKYNDQKEKKIEIGFQDPQNGMYTFTVKDNGIGIPEKHYEAIFRMFKRLHSRRSYGGGTGAGLTIVKKIVERHHGKIGLESVVGNGTTFYFTIPDNLMVNAHEVQEDSIHHRLLDGSA